MALYKTKAIVLRSLDLSETDKLVTFLSESYGKIKCVAKAARRIKSRFGASLEPLSCIHLIYFAKENQELYRLNSCDIIQSFQEVRENHDKFYTAVYFNELIDVLVREGGRGEDLFQLLYGALLRVQAQDDLETVLRLFELRLVSILGYTPGFGHCMLCRSVPQGDWVAFSYTRGGVLCEACKDRGPTEARFSAGTLSYLKKLLTMDIRNTGKLKIPKSAIHEIETVTHRLVLAHVGRELKSYPFIKQMAAVI
jgi:DNA repair protein RecO (recombination protein O)